MNQLQLKRSDERRAFKRLKYQMKKRIVYLDYLRLIASLAVIGIHVAGKGTYILGNEISSNPKIFVMAATIDSFLRFAVPIFFMISGAIVFSKSEMNLRGFYKQRAKRIIIPLIFWALFYSFVFNRGLSFQEHIKNMLLGNAFYHLWFLYAVIGIYLVAPVFYAFLKQSNKKDIELLLLISFIINTVLPIISSKYWVQLGESFNFNYLSGSIFYFILGYYLVNYDFKWLNKVPVAICCYLITSIIIAGCTVRASLQQGMHVTFYINTLWTLVIIQSTSLFVLVKKLYLNSKKLPSVLGEVVNSLGNYFMGVYLIHAFVLEIYQRIWVVNYQTVNVVVYGIHLLFGGIFVYLGSLVLIKLIRQVPILNKVI